MKKLFLLTLILLSSITINAQNWSQVNTKTGSAQYIEIPDVGFVFINDKTDALTFYATNGIFDFSPDGEYNKGTGMCSIYDGNGKLVNKSIMRFGGGEEEPSIAVALNSSIVSKVVSWIRNNKGSVRIIIPRYRDTDFDITVPTFSSQKQQRSKIYKGASRTKTNKNKIKR